MTIALKELYDILFTAFGNQHWWPVDAIYHRNQHSDPRFEIIIGAILTQNTAWTNVEKALANLKEHKALTIPSILRLQEKTLTTLLQPSGFFNQKAQRLRFITSHLHTQYQGDLKKFFTQETTAIRKELLSMPGIGPETADSILLYAGNHPVFVVDAYTKRICARLPIPVSSDSYDDIQCFFQQGLSTIPEKHKTSLYKEYHALLVALAKQHCWKKKPRCNDCPLNTLCEKLL
jgi:endonuclease III related protein